jgi:hypothetical protein
VRTCVVQLFSVGGIDRCILQWRTVGVNAADQEQDKYILKGLEEAAFHKHQVCPMKHHIYDRFVQCSHIVVVILQTPAESSMLHACDPL